jgi:class 3 adenylate cyclase
MAELTIAFADITGSVAVYEALGNDKAAKAITRLTQWIGSMAMDHGGQVVKMLGDGVLMSFADNLRAAECMADMQEQHVKRLTQWPESLRLQIQVGLARGEVVVVDGDCFGDAVNVAARLCDLAGPEQILAAGRVVDDRVKQSLRTRNLGPMSIRGRLEPCEVHRLEWQPEVMSEHMTTPSNLSDVRQALKDSVLGMIELGSPDGSKSFDLTDLPLSIGRALNNDFVVSDPRVSRQHARIDIRSGNYVFEDTSSYGSWVRFAGSDNVVMLRRQECFLHGSVEISMGAPFSDRGKGGTTIQFRVVEGSMVLGAVSSAETTVQSGLFKS